MLDRWVEDGLLDVLDHNGIGAVAFSPLAQGALTDRYLKGVPVGSRAAGEHSSFDPSRISPDMLARVRELDGLARERGQTLAQMALAWVLRRETVCSVIIGASNRAQVAENLRCLDAPALTKDELDRIDRILA
jgi:L-glyceraldehyde 3-phosphate reductase